MIRLSQSVLDNSEVEAVSRIILEDGYLGMGAEVGRFEADIANFLNVPISNVVCVSSGTAALHLVVEALLSPGDEVLVPSLTYLSSYQAISGAGAVPISCEVDEESLTISLIDAEQKITSKTKAIMPVHYASNTFELNQIDQFAAKYHLRVISDAAHSFGCKYQDRLIGSFGDVSCFSFDGIKNITAGEGGAIVTTDQRLLSIIRDTRLLGVENDSDKRYAGLRSWDFDVTRQGYRYHMSNIFAAIGRSQLAKFESTFSPIRQKYFNRYKEGLKNLPGILFQKIDSDAELVPHIFPIRVLNSKRDILKKYLFDKGIHTGIHYKPNHLLTFYKSNFPLPITEKLYDELLTLPLHPALTSNDIEEIIQQIYLFYNDL